MNTRTLEHSSRLVAATSWGAILSGVFVALALQTLLLLLGLAIAGSVGDEVPRGGFALWAVIVSIGSFMIGGALAGSVARADNRASGIAAGALMWAVALVVGNFLTGALGASMPRTSAAAFDTSWAWAPFFAALLALGAAIIGGVLGASLRGRRSLDTTTTTTATHPTTPTVGPI
jgi:hypothetical protein